MCARRPDAPRLPYMSPDPAPIVYAQDRVLVARNGFFFFNDTATTEIYTLSLHDALPISWDTYHSMAGQAVPRPRLGSKPVNPGDRKSTRLNSSHANISYAVLWLKQRMRQLDRGGLDLGGVGAEALRSALPARRWIVGRHL